MDNGGGGFWIREVGRGVPPGRRQAFAIAVTFGGTVTLIVVCASARVVTHTGVDLGSLPAWISAGGALFTAGGVLPHCTLTGRRDAKVWRIRLVRFDC